MICVSNTVCSVFSKLLWLQSINNDHISYAGRKKGSFKSNNICSVPGCSNQKWVTRTTHLVYVNDNYLHFMTCLLWKFRSLSVSLHSFPNGSKERKLWANKLRIEKRISKNARVCSKHFPSDNFISKCEYYSR